MFPIRPLCVTAMVALLAVRLSAEGVDIERADFFRKRIAPIFAAHCLDCHQERVEGAEGGLRLDDARQAFAGGRSGPAIVPGDVERSRLLEAVAWTNEHLQMPPDGRLAAEQISDLTEWIRDGAYWPEVSSDQPVPYEAASSDNTKALQERAKARRDHWAWQPIRPPKIPSRERPIDALVSATLAEKGLTRNPPAVSRILLRRVYLDLTGLPPTPQQCREYERDRRPDRYERLVDHLLASPAYGERWARHWLDVVRYTESNGFEYDRMRDHAWPYRDYVIRAWNQDLPYDEFMRQQIAGDVQTAATSDSIIATSFLVCGPFDQAGSNQANLVQRATTREEELEDLLSAVGQTFLGVTLNCARCHDHKFDPISQVEYYRVKSVFDGVKHGDRSVPLDVARMTNSDRRDGTESGAGTASESLIVYCGKRVEPPPTQWLQRGSVRTPGGEVTPAGLSLAGETDYEFSLAADAPEAERRTRFAAWLTDPRNPLPARVIVNRLWQYHFGQGLVTTSSDFGAGGTAPSHPELLDWLAGELIRSDWSLKKLQRAIVCSETYRQSSEIQSQALAIDADNRLLWRFTPRRLEAEAVRDTMLLVSGELNRQMGGPSVRPFTTTDFNATFYHPFDQGTAEFNRRTVYRMNVNSGKDPLLDVLDCPDPAMKTPRRNTTITPLQALSLMNGTFVQRQATRLAERIERMLNGSSDHAVRVSEAYQRTLLRQPDVTETERATQHIEEFGLESLCWALLNSTEFLYVQ